MEHYTITEVAKKLGLKRHIVLKIAKSGQVQTKKGEKPTSPYQIPKTELKAIEEIATSKNPITVANKTPEVKKLEAQSPKMQENSHYAEFVQMQKILMETMRDLASTQDKIAEALVWLSKKM